MKKISNALLTVLAAAVIGGLGITIIGTGHAASASGSMSLSPASGPYTVGDTITVSVYENSGTTNAIDSTTGINSANVVLNYPQASLQFLSFDAGGSGFNQPGPANSGGNGTVSYETNQAGSPLTNSQLVIKVNFKVLAAATAGVTFNSASGLGTPAGHDTGPTFANASYTLKAPVTPPPTPTPTPTPTPPPATTPPSVSNTPPAPAGSSDTSTTSSNSSADNVAVTPSGSSDPVALPDNSSAQVSAAATIQPPETAGDPITKAEYFLNGKLVATTTQAPYSYKLDTPNLRNGKYTLKVKTFYASGKVALTAQHIDVKNPFSFKQFLLELSHLAWVFIVAAMLVAIVVCIRFLRSNTGQGSDSGGNSDTTLPANPNNPVQTFLDNSPHIIKPGSTPEAAVADGGPSVKINNIQLGKPNNPQPGTVVQPNETKV